MQVLDSGLGVTNSALAIIGALVVLVSIAGGLWAIFRSADRDATEKRLRGEAEDYLRRLNYIEPRLVKAEEQNELLLALHNPNAKLDLLSANDATIIRLLGEQGTTLKEGLDKIHEAIGDQG